MIRLLLVDDHVSLRQALAFVLDRQADMSVAAQAGTLAEARAALERLGDGVDLALLDLGLPDGFGTELIPDLRAANPRAPVLLLTAFSEKGYLAQAIEAGASSVLDKAADLEEIVDAARRLYAGEQLIPPEEVLEMVRLSVCTREQDRDARLALGRLTARELDFLQALADGLNDKDIARRLHVGAGTVRIHMSSIYKKLGVESRLQALVFALRHGAVELGRTTTDGLSDPKGGRKKGLDFRT